MLCRRLRRPFGAMFKQLLCVATCSSELPITSVVLSQMQIPQTPLSGGRWMGSVHRGVYVLEHAPHVVAEGGRSLHAGSFSVLHA